MNDVQQRASDLPKPEHDRNVVNKQLIPVGSTPAAVSSKKPKLSSRMVKKSN